MKYFPVEPCCAYTLQRATWELPAEDKSDLETQTDPFEGICCANIRRKIWRLFEDADSSKPALVRPMIKMRF